MHTETETSSGFEEEKQAYREKENLELKIIPHFNYSLYVNMYLC